MNNRSHYDLTYITIDSISEGVGASQIVPLLKILSQSGMSINLISFEKKKPDNSVLNVLKDSGVIWNQRIFQRRGPISGLSRILEISREIPPTKIIHARSDIPAAAAGLFQRAPILWDIRGLWSDQRVFMEPNPIKKRIISNLRLLEDFSSLRADAISTLTSSVVPILQERHKNLPKKRIVVPTATDLEVFSVTKPLPQKIRGLYSGTYSNYYDLELSKRFINELKRQRAIEVHWARPQETLRKELNGGESSIFVSTQGDMSKIIAEYSFGLSICRLDAGPSLRGVMPTKVGEFLASGRPVVINSGLGDLDEFLLEFNAGVSIDDSEISLRRGARELLALLDNPQTPERCRALAEKYFDIRVGANKYLNLYEEINN